MVARTVGMISSLLLGGNAARLSRRREGVTTSNVKFLSGVPILNYDLAYGGEVGTQEAADDWNVFMRPGATDAEVQKLCSRAKCLRAGHPSAGGVPYFEVRGTEEDLLEVLAGAADTVQFIEPDSQAHVDPVLAPAADSISWGLDRIGAPKRANRGAGSHVYVLDTGIRVSHSDFEGRALATLDFSISNTLTECDGSATCARDTQGHGTHCSGTAAGTTFGVAPDAELHAVKVLSDSGEGQYSWSFDALDWLATKGERPAVASMSLGGQGIVSGMKLAVDAAVAAGVVVVVAAGNSNRDACGFSPAYVSTAITVGSSTSTDARSGFSNYGTCVEIWAPGSHITSAGVRSDTATATLDGTSMACPHVSGAVALELEKNPGAGSVQALDALVQNAAVNVLSGLKSGDTNVLLYVGADGPPAGNPPAEPDACPVYCGLRLCILPSCVNNCDFCAA